MSQVNVRTRRAQTRGRGPQARDRARDSPGETERPRGVVPLRSASGRVAESVCGCAVGSAWVWVFGAGLLKTPTVAGGGANETNYIVCELFADAAASSVPKFHSAKPERSGAGGQRARGANKTWPTRGSRASRLGCSSVSENQKARPELSQRVASVASVGTSMLGEQPKHEHHLARYRGDIGKI